MKIHVPTLPEAGRLFRFDAGEEWMKTLLAERLKDVAIRPASLKGYVQLLRSNNNISLSGHLNADLSPACDRCAQDFDFALDANLQRYLVPYFPEPKASLAPRSKEQEEEIELQEEDLNFSAYHNEEIDLAEIIAEEILLALPMRFLCNESCQGLCTRCGANLNQQKCQCDPGPPDNPFRALKDVKFRKE